MADKLNEKMAELKEKMGEMGEDATPEELQKMIGDISGDLKEVTDMVMEMTPEDMEALKKEDDDFKNGLKEMGEAMGTALEDLEKLKWEEIEIVGIIEILYIRFN